MGSISHSTALTGRIGADIGLNVGAIIHAVFEFDKKREPHTTSIACPRISRSRLATSG